MTVDILLLAAWAFPPHGDSGYVTWALLSAAAVSTGDAPSGVHHINTDWGGVIDR